MKRNIHLSYVISFIRYAWFWLGIWVLYYLQFTNYTGIGLIEMVMITSGFLFEIPTGAIGDLIGKKKTLILAFIWIAIGNVWMGFAHSLTDLLLSVLCINIGGAFFSGTFEALTYDSLLEMKKVDLLEKVQANQKTLELVGLTVCGFIGGVVYQWSPSYPFWALAVISIIGVVVCLFLTEPYVDTEKFSFSNYVIQTKAGYKELFSNSNLTYLTLFLVSFSMLYLVLAEGLEDMVLVEAEFTSAQLGFMAGGMSLAMAFISQLIARVIPRLKPLTSLLFLGVVYSVTLLLVPFSYWLLLPLFFVLRQSIVVATDLFTSKLLNKEISSKNRATALSTFEMIKKIPYIFLALPIGYVADVYSAKKLAFGLGCLLLLVIVHNYLRIYPKLSQNS